MSHSIRKILFNKPWLLPVLGFLLFVMLWIAFIVLAVNSKPPEVGRHAATVAAAPGQQE